MAKKLRKMLGDVNAPSTVELMKLIDTQSKSTICNWCINYAEEHILPIFKKRYPNDNRPQNALNAARDYLDGKVKFPVVKNIILNECHAAARELDSDPAAQAAARACGQGSAVVHTLSHSIGIYFYGAAAIAYDSVGVNETTEVYDKISEKVCLEMIANLQAIAVKDEPNPAKVKWTCSGDSIKWKCPKCGREFEKTEQNHFCGKINTIDDYIADQRTEVRPLLQAIRNTIRTVAPNATEKISWRMPTFWQGENLVHFAAFKNHIGLYPGGEAVGVFAERLTGYKTSKGSIQFPISKPIDHELIADIVRWRVEQTSEHTALR